MFVISMLIHFIPFHALKFTRVAFKIEIWRNLIHALILFEHLVLITDLYPCPQEFPFSCWGALLLHPTLYCLFCKSSKPEFVSSHQEYLCTKFWSSIALAAVVHKLSKFVSLFTMSIITSKSNVSIIFFTFPGPLLFMHIFLGNYKYKIFDNKPNIQPGPCIRLHDPVSDCMTL